MTLLLVAVLGYASVFVTAFKNAVGREELESMNKNEVATRYLHTQNAPTFLQS
jgi:hypothetical protein